MKVLLGATLGVLLAVLAVGQGITPPPGGGSGSSGWTGTYTPQTYSDPHTYTCPSGGVNVTFAMTLSGSVTMATFDKTACSTGQTVQFCFTENATGGYTHAAPTNTTNFGIIETTHDVTSCQQFKFDGSTLNAISKMDVVNPSGPASLTLEHGPSSGFASPAANSFKLFFDSSNSDHMTRKNSSGTDVDLQAVLSGGDFSSNTSTSVDSEFILFSGTGGKTGKRAAGTGLARAASGVASFAELSGDVVTVGSNAATISNNAVTLAKMATMATASLLGRNTAGTGIPEVLAASTVRSLLSLVPGTDVQAYDAALAALAAGSDFVQFTGPATSTKVFTLPNVSSTILTTNAAVTFGQGGTGQTSYSDGQLLIGNTATGGLSKATLTAGANITITNGNGTIQIAASASSGCSVAGSDKYVIFNDGGSACGADSGLQYDKSTKILTVVGGVAVGDGTTAGYLKMNEVTSNGTNFRKWLVPDALTADLTMTFPDAVPSANDVLVFSAPSSSVSTLSFAQRELPLTFGAGLNRATNTITADLSTLVSSQTIFDGSQASRTITFNLSGTDPVLTLSSAVFNLSTGAIQQGGTQVALTGVDINTSHQVTVTHLAAALPSAQGGTDVTTHADDNILVGNGTVWQSKALADCQDSSGNHLNYTASTNAFSCGTTNSGGAAGANTALSNLASVSINTALIPQTAVDLGAAATAFRDLYLYGAGTFSTTSLKFTGTPTGNRTVTFPDLTGTVLVASTSTTATQVMFATATAGAPAFRAIVASDLPTALSSQTSINGVAVPSSLTNGGLLYASSTAGWTSNANFTLSATTLTGGASAVLDLSAMSVTAGFKLPSSAGAAPTADGFCAFDTTAHAPVCGFNGTKRQLITLDGTETLANKTLTAPVIATISNTGTVTLFTATDTVVGKATTDTLTNKTYNVESAGNVFTAPSFVVLWGGGCQNTTATSFWDLPTSTPAAAACATGTNIQKGVLAYADTSGGFSAQTSFAFPPDWTTGTAPDVDIQWTTTATTGNAKWTVQFVCTDVAASATDDPAFPTSGNGFNTVTTAAPGTASRVQTSTITGATLPSSCVAATKELVHVRLFRDGNDGADTIGATANFVVMTLTVRRAM